MDGPDSGEPNALTIEAWCRLAADGNVIALERLLWVHHSRLAGFARRKIGTDWQGRIDVDDLLQDAYVDIFQTIGNFAYHDEDSFYHWATRIIEHRFIDRVRSLRRKKRDAGREVTVPDRSTSRHESFLDRCFRETVTPSRIMRREDAINALMTCIAKLPEDYRLVVRRYHLEEVPLSVIAADLGRSEDAIRRMASRAVERLTTCLRNASRYFSSHDAP
ncbi:MAG TPA: sigma-70 family RNA polymerase sigma factor [Phycisphaerae bacterium]|nr:sigma-70 family RNA polymerase sigma factor [Phycisphaerae bacterium]